KRVKSLQNTLQWTLSLQIQYIPGGSKEAVAHVILARHGLTLVGKVPDIHEPTQQELLRAHKALRTMLNCTNQSLIIDAGLHPILHAEELEKPPQLDEDTARAAVKCYEDSWSEASAHVAKLLIASPAAINTAALLKETAARLEHEKLTALFDRLP